MLLKLDPDSFQKLLDDYEKIVIDIKKSAMTMAWYMRGGATYEDILNMSTTEREALKELIDNNLETTKKSGLPFF
jgi:hypothetical protein